MTANEFVPLVLASYQIPFSDLHVCSGDTTEFQVLAAYVQVQDTITPVHRNGVVSAVHAASATAPATFALHQNYPNPFNPTTTIAFDLPRATHVRLSVFDLSGRLVSTLVDAAVPAGSHRVTWNARGLATGIYFLRMNAGGSVELRKMILMK